MKAPRALRWPSRRRAVAVGALVLGILLVPGPVLYMRVVTAAHRYSADDVPRAPVAIVLGAGVRDGRPSPFLQRRLDVAVDLFHRGRVRGLLMSGDNSTRNYDEVGVMADYAIARGVPADVVAQDHAGFDTYDSCYRAAAIFGVTRAVVVTQTFHLARAVFICRELGMQAWGVGDDTSRSWPGLTRRLELREVFSSGKALWETKVSRPQPHFLGPPVPALNAVLAGG